MASSLAAVLVAVVVAWAMLPTQSEIGREVATDLGVPPAVLGLPLVAEALDLATSRARQAVLDATREALLLGAAAGVATSVVLASVVAWRQAQRVE